MLEVMISQCCTCVYALPNHWVLAPAFSESVITIISSPELTSVLCNKCMPAEKVSVRTKEGKSQISRSEAVCFALRSRV